MRARTSGFGTPRVVTILAALVLGVALLLAAAPTPAHAAARTGRGRVSFTQVQQDFMCTICHEPLNEARSDEAYEENALLRQLIARGDSYPQIRTQMVAQFGPAVLAIPSKRGFGLFAYVIPVVIIILGVGVIAFLIPRWRRRAGRSDPDDPLSGASPSARLSDAEAARLDAELARADT